MNKLILHFTFFCRKSDIKYEIGFELEWIAELTAGFGFGWAVIDDVNSREPGICDGEVGLEPDQHAVSGTSDKTGVVRSAVAA